MDCHMMVSRPEQVKCILGIHRSKCIEALLPKWVDAIANAGGKLYCFHIEATCKSTHRMLVSYGCPKAEHLDDD